MFYRMPTGPPRRKLHNVCVGDIWRQAEQREVLAVLRQEHLRRPRCRAQIHASRSDQKRLPRRNRQEELLPGENLCLLWKPNL